MSESITINFGRPIPLFPLPGLVLMPPMAIPLHMFEPRYVKLTRDALDSRGLIAIAMFEKDALTQVSYELSPPVRQYVCVGHINRHFVLPDGRYNLVLQGICRARIIEEVETDEPYRLVMLEPTERPDEATPALEIVHRKLMSMLDDDHLSQLAAVTKIKREREKGLPARMWIDMVINCLCDDNEHRYEMLAESDPHRRSIFLTRYLMGIRRSLMIAERFMPEVRDDGTTLN